MKINICLFFYLFVGTANAAIINGFTDDYDVSNWTQSLNGGSIDLTGAPNSIIATSSDVSGRTEGPAFNTDFTIIALGDALVNFDWLYNTQDVDGSEFDPFGWLLNDVFTQLTVDDFFTTQSGTESFSVVAGDTFGFRLKSIDSAFGSSITTISNFSAPSATVPEPASLVLLGLGLAGISFARKKRTS